MIKPEQIKQIFTRISQGEQTAQDIDVLNQAFLGEEKITVQVGKNIVNIGKGNGIHIGDRTYHSTDTETIKQMLFECGS